MPIAPLDVIEKTYIYNPDTGTYDIEEPSKIVKPEVNETIKTISMG